MPAKIVVSFRGAVPGDPGAEARYLDRALGLKQRAEALGATLCAWGAEAFAFGLSLDDLEEAVSLAALAAEGDPPAERFAVGMAHGEMRALGEGGTFAALGWGRPLVVAAHLAGLATAGEVLMDADLWNARPDELLALGVGMAADAVRGVQRLEPPRPTHDPPPPSRAPSRPTSQIRPSVPPLVRPPASQRPGALAEASGPPSARSALPGAAGTPGEASAADGPAPPRASLAPPSRPRASLTDLELDPQDLASQLADLAKQALVQGDLGTLERLITQLRVTGEHGDLVERMSGFVALGRGATAEALRRLRAVAESEQSPDKRARARLAYGVALAAAGRTESAILEGLEALARAREVSDRQGQHACALFLARLSAGAGHQASAARWAEVAAASPTASAPA